MVGRIATGKAENVQPTPQLDGKNAGDDEVYATIT
jgi:hypothetical protein